jgi:Tfp pilus assembly protein PilF
MIAFETFEHDEDKSLMLNNLANARITLSQRERAHENLIRAEALLQQALRLWPANSDASFNLGKVCSCCAVLAPTGTGGKVFAMQGKLAAARHCFRESLTARPTFARAAINLGNLEYERANYSGAMWWYDHASQLECESSDLAVIYTYAMKSAAKDSKHLRSGTWDSCIE